MLDKTANPQHLGQPRRLCIIGSGISGLVATKVMRERGDDVTVFEKNGDIGGVWEPARSYPGVRTQTPGSMYAYTDFAMPSDYPEWPTGAQVHAYLDAYAARSGLRDSIHFRHEVLNVVRPKAAGVWSVKLRDETGAETTESFDDVIVATGQFSAPRHLDLPGADAFTSAGGRIEHSSEYVDAEAAKGRDVVVVGFSKSATDVAMNALGRRRAQRERRLSRGDLEDPVLLRRLGQLQEHSLLPRLRGDVHAVGAERRRPCRARPVGADDLGELARARIASEHAISG